MSPITTHVLDVTRGLPAVGIRVELEILEDQSWRTLGEGTTDEDGRAKNLLPEGSPLAAGTYRLTFAVAAYFESLGVEAFYPEVQVTFLVPQTGARAHYHVPLLLSPFGYSTYRGS